MHGFRKTGLRQGDGGQSCRPGSGIPLQEGDRRQYPGDGGPGDKLQYLFHGTCVSWWRSCKIIHIEDGGRTLMSISLREIQSTLDEILQPTEITTATPDRLIRAYVVRKPDGKVYKRILDGQSAFAHRKTYARNGDS